MNRAYRKSVSIVAGVIALIMGLNMVFGEGKVKGNTAPFPPEIVFTHGKWKDIAAIAKKSGRYIFVDAYTSWCAPCRQLKKVTFKQNAAAAYYNSNFINYTVDMEAGEGVALAGEWEVMAYPTLLFFTPEGKMVMKQIGYVDGKQLVELGRQALDRK